MSARRGARVALLLGVLAIALVAVQAGGAQTPPPIDPQNPGWQPDMTWDDYTAVPGPDYTDPSIQPSVRKFRVALSYSSSTYTYSWNSQSSWRNTCRKLSISLDDGTVHSLTVRFT